MSTTKKEKVAILGGGIAGLTAAFELTRSPNWQDKYDITIYQMGWRLGGKCATGRGPNSRIEEHGIHGFLGSYYNALPLMADVFEACDRKPGEPLATFHEAFKPENFVLMWEFRKGNWEKWPLTMPSNSMDPAKPGEVQTIETIYRDVAKLLGPLFETLLDEWRNSPHKVNKKLEKKLPKLAQGIVEHILNSAFDEVLKLLKEGRSDLKKALSKIMGLAEGLIDDIPALRHLYIGIDFMLALLEGTIADGVLENGFDPLDDENFDTWLARHGAHDITISSPLALNTPNLSYQYPNGDTSLPPLMAAGTYLHWTLRSFAFMGSFAWMFAAGTGESIIGPMYDALKKRGVNFKFFHKVTNLQLNDAMDAIEAIDIDVQATLKKGVSEYTPQIAISPPAANGHELMVWPPNPNYDQLAQGEELEKQAIDLESYWTPWNPVEKISLKAGQEFDKVIFAIAIGAVPYVCKELLEAKKNGQPTEAAEKWQKMVAGIPTTQTQTMQLWLSETSKDLGVDFDLKGYDTTIGATYVGPINGQVDFTKLLPWEEFPAAQEPKALWYFSGTMTDETTDAPPPLTDHDYPARSYARVKHQCVQYLQAATGPLMPKGTTNANTPPGDPMSLDFGLLVCTEDDKAQGVARFDQQFYRANIDPTERYTQSPPGSTACRVKAWETGYSNLVITGDWIYTGLNVGSVEGTVMGGKLASYAVSGYPKLEDIAGYQHSL